MFHPKNAFIVTTTDCNRRDDCVFCFYNTQPERLAPSRLTTEALYGLLAKLRLMGVSSVYFTGGEPLLRPDIVAAVTRARSMGLTTQLLSNGTLLTPSLADALDRAGLDLFILSLKSVSPAERDMLAAAARFRHTAVSLIFVITRKNHACIPDAIKLARAARVPILFQPVFIPAGHALERDLSLRNLNRYDWSFLHTSLRLWARNSSMEGYWRFIREFYHELPLNPPACRFVRDALVVDADGAAYPCFHRRDLPCGNVLEDDFSAILKRVAVTLPLTIEGACFGEHCLSLHTGTGKE